MPPIAIARRFAATALGASLHYLEGGVRKTPVSLHQDSARACFDEIGIMLVADH
jgi:hypothetical protein